MTDRVHAFLDGELAREALSDDEQKTLIAMESAVNDAVHTLRTVEVPDLSAAVLARLPEAGVAPNPFRQALSWFWQPRALAITFRPAYAFGGMMAAALAATMLVSGASAPHVMPPVVAGAEAPRMFVQFRLEAIEASHVELAGSFTDWLPSYHLEETAPGVWSVMVPLRPGVHDYTFVVDGEEWVVDPYAPRVPDSFGGSNSRLFLPSPTGAA